MKFLPIILLFTATIGSNGYSQTLECEILMAKLLLPYSQPDSIYFKSRILSGGCIDDKHAYIYDSFWPDVLMFVSVSKDSFVTDSVIDFNHSFVKYANMEDLKQSIKYIDIDNFLSKLRHLSAKDMNKMLQSVNNKNDYHENGKYRSIKGMHPYISFPVIYKKKDSYQLITTTGMHEISFQNKEFTKVLEFEEKKGSYLVKHCTTTTTHVSYRRKFKVHFFPKYTKITSNFNKSDSSYIILHDNGEITTNIESKVILGYCLSVRKLNTKENIENEEWEEIAVFGHDCTPNIEYGCELELDIFKSE